MAEEIETPQRVLCVDVLRGFDMFWLCGGTGFALGLLRVLGGGATDHGDSFTFNNPGTKALAAQLDHAAWVGFTFYDLIFPLFIFVSGMSIVFSVGRLVETRGLLAAYARILRRTALMFLLGVIYYGFLNQPLDHVRWLGVLQRIALCYGATALLYCHLRVRGMAICAVSILIGYWILLAFIPVPGGNGNPWDEQLNWAAWVDRAFLPGAKNGGDGWDTNGLLGTLPAVASCILGVLAAEVLRAPRLPAQRKLLIFLCGGAAMLLLGYIWGIEFPIIKKLWTSTYALVAGGYSFLLLGVLYYLVDLRESRWWIAPFVWIGMNPLTIYLARNIVDFNAFALRFTGGSVASAAGPDGAYFLKVLVSLLLSLVFVWYLHKKRIFLRV